MNDNIISFPAKSSKKQARKKQTVPQGFLVISVKQGAGCYRHLKVPKKAKLDGLADAILWSFDFINDHAHAFFMDNIAWSENDCYYVEDVDEENEFPHTCDHDLTVFQVGQKFKFVFDFGDDWRFDCSVLREIPDGTSDEVEIVRTKGDAPSQYGAAGDRDDDVEDDETGEEAPDDDDDK